MGSNPFCTEHQNVRNCRGEPVLKSGHRSVLDIGQSIRMNTVTQFTDCLLLRNHQLIKEDLWISGGRIINPGPLFFGKKTSADKKVHCNGNIIAPGFIDLQINGAFGKDFRQVELDKSLGSCHVLC